MYESNCKDESKGKTNNFNEIRIWKRKEFGKININFLLLYVQNVPSYTRVHNIGHN